MNNTMYFPPVEEGEEEKEEEEFSEDSEEDDSTVSSSKSEEWPAVEQHGLKLSRTASKVRAAYGEISVSLQPANA